MEAYATVTDLQQRWRPLSPSELERAGALLEDNSVIIKAMLERSGIDMSEPSDGYLHIIKTVTCEATRRMMMAPADQAPLSSLQQMAGPYQQMQSFANPSGDLYLTRLEKHALGIGGGHAAFIEPRIGGSQ